MDAWVPRADAVFPNGVTVGRYRIEGIIGRGGMGIVYRALDVSLDRPVALKCIRPDQAGDADRERKMVREARAASRLSHPNIVRVLEVLDLQGLPGIVMELVDGVSLRSRLDAGPIPLEEVLRFGMGLAEALAAAHDKGILHRDINPNNVLLAMDGRALLTDFGLARTFVPPGSSSDISTSTDLSGSGALAGTPGYISPDQLLGKRPDPRSDIFSLGLVLYEMCTGARAFSPDRPDLFDALLNQEPVAIGRLNYAVPDELERIVRKAIAKRPDERYQNANDLAVDLRALVRKRESGDAAMPVRPRASGRWIAMGAAVLAAVGLAVVAWRLTDRPVASGIPRVTTRQLTSDPAPERHPRVSPDGSFVTFAAGGAGAADIWLLDVETGQRLRITDDPGDDDEPTWFPDGSSIAFASDRSGQSAIWKVPRLGGSNVMLAPDGSEPAVAPDGERLAFVRKDDNGRLRVWVAPIDDVAAARRLTDASAGAFDHRHPAWSPDGSEVVYEDYDGLWLVPAAGGAPRRLSPLDKRSREQDPVWSPDGRHVYYSSRAGGTRALWRIARAGDAPEAVTTGGGFERDPSLSRNGKRLVYATQSDDRRIVLADLESGERVRVPELPGQSSPAFAQDGSRLLCLSFQLGTTNLWSVPLVGGLPQGEPRKLTELAGGIGTFALSPDGRYLAYHQNVAGQRDIWIRPTDGGVAVDVTDHAAADLCPAWSPDGGRIAFASDRDGHQNLWVQAIAQGRAIGPARRVTSGSSTDWYPAWSPDGASLAFVRESGEGTDVWTVGLADSSVPVRVTRDAGARSVQWDPDGRRLVVSAQWKGRDTLLRVVRLPEGDVVPLRTTVTLPTDGLFGEFSLSRDGKRVAYLEQEERGDIWMMESTGGNF